MKQPTEVLEIFTDYNSQVEDELQKILAAQNNLEMYGMMGYFFGFLNENFREYKVYAGKRFRSGLCMLISSMYGKENLALEPATAIELFHNMTLIHDDLVDRDPLRRGRQTVWKVWGADHAINTGDAQLILVTSELNKGLPKIKRAFELERFLFGRFLEVTEGQFLDFKLTDLPIDDKFVSEENYLEMIQKKTSVLIGAATKAAGYISGLDDRGLEALWEYGLNLGLAYQLCDDLVSIWGDPEITGKIAGNDLIVKKKTLPVLYLFSKLEGDKKQKLTRIYNKKGDLTESEINLFIEELDKAGAYDYTWNKLEEYKEKSIKSVKELSISAENKELLIKIVNALLPNVKEICKC
jgi:geranylgeranyl diphosphate synthase type II